MVIREAVVTDIAKIQVVRNSVRENVLSDPSLVTDEDCREFLLERGKGWVCESRDGILGFSIVDMKENNVWALFVHPDFENQGIGRKLHDVMLNWYFSQTDASIWLGTAPNTRAEQFYKKSGWDVIGTHGKGEVKFEMTRNKWILK
ncbi:GNAT family N-acetyltransferase [Robertkochia solimangrovi]|uniref:GNAT family N-acetyltransferase n=1 Tax=Robertkochia solimangrovi TaxID=2213046 RepID=UPI00117D345A|nr:GNAT family N-acetyltransferase [Robertkochia solimangrovi]TRZ44351.1 GNAT family N-acetyltransferase [Robertkochia solimangrovi]